MASNSKNLAELLNSDVTLTATDIANGAVTTDKLADDAVTAAKVSDQVATGGRRNLIINGDMRISQRATSFTPSSSTTVYTLDRNTIYYNMGTHAVEQSTDAPAGFTNSFKITVTTAGTIGGNTINQWGVPIEGYDTRGLGWDGKGSAKQAAASFWVKTSVAGTYAYRIRLGGTGTIVKEFTVNSANTWEYKTIIIPVCPYTIPNFANGTGIFVGIQLDCGTTYQSTANGAWETPDKYGTAGMTNNFGQTLNATFQITGHQFEIGDTATPFEHRSYGEELSLCQRYYNRSLDLGNTETGPWYNQPEQLGSGYGRAHIPFNVVMRTDPTVTVSTNNTNYTAIGTQFVTNRNFTSYLNGMSASNYVTQWTADAEL